MRSLFSAGRWLVFFALVTALSAQPPRSARVDASAPLSRESEGGALKLHESFLARGKAGPIGLLFLGDSITGGWSRAPRIWDDTFGKYQPANFGVDGDTTQNLIWRIEHGELDGIHPKVTVLMIGTNNSGSHSAAQITAACKKIVDLIRSKIPETKILLLGILPRGPWREKGGTPLPFAIIEANWRMAVSAAVNSQLAGFADGRDVRFLDFGERLLGPDGSVADAFFMHDQLHLSVAGYQVWADAMQPLLTEMWAQK
jgi:beta-glucosidase